MMGGTASGPRQVRGARRFVSVMDVVPILAVLLVTALAGRAGAQGPGFDAAHLPDGWTLARDVTLPEADVRRFETNLGAKLAGIRSQFVTAGGLTLQLNLVTAQSEGDAVRVEQFLSGTRGPDFVVRQGCAVVEFARMNLLAAKACRHALALPAEADIVWQATFRVACVQSLDYMEMNRVFNLCLAADRDPPDAGAQATIDSLVADWTFGNALRLRAPGPGHDASYSFVPAPVEVLEQDGALLYRFADLPVVHGMPAVTVTATIRVGDRFSPVDGPRGADVAAPWWNLEDAQAQALCAGLAGEAKSDRERLAAVFAHVRQRIKDGGSETGSRYGVARTFTQGYGHCWDKSDALVAMCRAAGLLARETAGWLGALDTGHVWTEVYLDGEGWLAVDATCPWLGVSADYMPWFVTEDGEMPFVYLGMPQVKRLQAP